MNPPCASLRHRRTLINLLAVGLGLNLAGVPGAAAGDAPATIQLEAETGQRAGNVTAASTGSGYSGAGYVTGFLEDADRVTLTFAAKAGLYEIAIRYRSPVKGFEFEVNGLALVGEVRRLEGRLCRTALRQGGVARGDKHHRDPRRMESATRSIAWI